MNSKEITKNVKVLVLETPNRDLEDLCNAFYEVTQHKCTLEKVYSFNDLKTKLQSGLVWDMVLLDYHLGNGHKNGIDTLVDIRSTHPDVPIVITSQYGDVTLASTAIHSGANDFLVRSGKLFDRVATLLKKIKPHLNLLQRNRILQEQNMLLQAAASQKYNIVGESPQLMEVIDRVQRVAKIPRPVLITGERGTGKELVARAIHIAAGHTDRPMVTINCAAFPENLLESELFGYEKGAFTGAVERRHGKFELASGGTLFLDEIGNMTITFQQKILRVVEYGTFSRVGGTAEIKVNTRIIAATNVDLKESMQKGDFLQDLYDRLSFEIIHLPPLRQRQGDIVLLARHFLKQFIEEIPFLKGKRLSPSALDVLSHYSFPGNIRELKTIIERAAYRDTTSEITPEDIGILPRIQPQISVSGNTFYEKVEQFKASLIKEALDKSSGNQAKAARLVGLSYHQYRYFLKKYLGMLEQNEAPA